MSNPSAFLSLIKQYFVWWQFSMVRLSAVLSKTRSAWQIHKFLSTFWGCSYVSFCCFFWGSGEAFSLTASLQFPQVCCWVICPERDRQRQLGRENTTYFLQYVKHTNWCKICIMVFKNVNSNHPQRVLSLIWRLLVCKFNFGQLCIYFYYLYL